MLISFIESTTELSWLVWVERVLGTFSMMGSGLIILIFCKNLKKITPAFELIMQLSLMSLINTISYLILFIPPDTNEYSHAVCQTQGVLMLFSEISTIAISTVISFYIWKTKAELNSKDKFNCKDRSLYLSFIYIIPIIFSSICFFSYRIGENGRWCWIDKDSETFGLIEYFAIWILIFLNIIFACLTWKITNNNLHSEEIKNRRDYIKKLSRYPLISFCCWLPATISRIITIFEFAEHSKLKIGFIFQILHIIFNLSQGYLYALVSLSSVQTDKNFKKLIKSFFGRCCSKFNRKLMENPHDDLTQYLSNSDRRITVCSHDNSFSDRQLPESQKGVILN